LELYRREDGQSAALLEAYLDRTQGADWRRSDDGGAGPGGRREGNQAASEGGKMNRDEALAVLGLAPGADEATIRDAHRRLMQRLHPDRGGSDYLAAKLNEAKRVLLGD
jgi:DnaJ-domain-containing protein 1